jgi:hypothetical protein
MALKPNPDTQELDYYMSEKEMQPFKVGSIYLNVTGVNPAIELGYGTWVQVAQGMLLV